MFAFTAAEVRVPFPVGATVEFLRALAAARAFVLHQRGWAVLWSAATHADASVEKLAVGTGGDFTAVAAAPYSSEICGQQPGDIMVARCYSNTPASCGLYIKNTLGSYSNKGGDKAEASN